jgi:hypothetical protein
LVTSDFREIVTARISVAFTGGVMDQGRRRALQIGAACAAAGFFPMVWADTLPPLSESDPVAQSLGYKANAAQVDKTKFPQYAAGQSCSNCSLFMGTAGATSGPCPLYAGKAVSATGWCASYAKKS